MLSSALKKQLETPKNIVFTAHKGPDGDACGSTIAMAQYFRALGHETTVVLPNAIPKNLRQVFDFESIVSFDNKENLAKRKLKEADILFCLDYNNPSRVGDMEADLVASSAYKVMIDHHLYPKTFCDEQHSFPEVSSSCQLVYRCLDDYGLTSMYTPEIMASLYTGMLTDTGSFRFSSVDAETHYIVYK
ncbi:MAG: DHH family phosphoesterase, partial [Flavobacteriales bacterium]